MWYDIYIRIVGDDKMNISVDFLLSLRKKLDNDYDEIESKINKMYTKNKSDNVQDLIKKQDLVDMQLDLIDSIIYNLENTPKLYNKLVNINDEYKQM